MTKRPQHSLIAGLIQPRKMKAKILKRMTVDGKILEPGTVLDVTSWRTAAALKNNRYIEFISDESVVEVKEEAKKTKSKQEKDSDSK